MIIKFIGDDTSERIKIFGGGWVVIWFTLWVITTIGVIWS
jgi:hypothetical protein